MLNCLLMDADIFVVMRYPESQLLPAQSDAFSEHGFHHARKKTGSVSSISSASSRHTIQSASGVTSSSSAKFKTPIIKLPVVRPKSFPVRKMTKLPNIHQERHERLQSDFYKLRHCLSVLSSGRAPSYINGRLFYRMIQTDAQRVDPKPHPFMDYLQRLKLKNELPWRVNHGYKLKPEKEILNKKVYFHLDLD